MLLCRYTFGTDKKLKKASQYHKEHCLFIYKQQQLFLDRWGGKQS